MAQEDLLGQENPFDQVGQGNQESPFHPVKRMCINLLHVTLFVMVCDTPTHAHTLSAANKSQQENKPTFNPGLNHCYN